MHEVLIVQGQNFARDSLDPGVDQVEAIFPCVDVSDDSVVYIDEGVFSLLDTG